MKEFFEKWYLWMLYVLIGVVAHLCNLILNNKKYKTAQVLASTAVALFVGYISSVWCIQHCPEEGKYIVPIATLLADKIFQYIAQVDWSVLIVTLSEIFRKK